MPNGKLEIEGLDELIKKINILKSDLESSVDSLGKMVKAVDGASKAELNSAKSITELNKQLALQAKTESDSIILKNKAEKSTKDLEIAEQKRLKAVIATEMAEQKATQQTNKLNAAKQKSTENTNTWTKALGSFQAKFNILGNFLGGSALSAVTKIGQAFKDGLNTVTDFEKGIAELSAITGATGDDLKFLEKAAIQLGSNTEIAGVKINKSAKDIVEAFKLAASAKPELLANVQALKSFTEQAIILAQASNGEVKNSITALTQIMNQFNAPTEDASKFINLLAAGAKFGAGEVDFLQEAITKTGVAAKTAGISVETTAATMELFAEKGMTAEKSGISFRNILLKLQQDTSLYTNGIFDYSKALDYLEKNQYNTIALAEKFGAENVVSALALAQNRDRVEELTKSMTGSNAAYEQAEVNSKTLAFATKGLGSAWDSFVLSISSSGGVLTSVVNAASFSLKGLSLLIREAAAMAKGDNSELARIEEERLNLAGKLSEKQLWYISEYRKYVNEKRASDKALSEEEVLELKKTIYKIKGIRVEEIDDYKKYVDSKRQYNANLTKDELEKLAKVKKAQDEAAKLIENEEANKKNKKKLADEEKFQDHLLKLEKEAKKTQSDWDKEQNANDLKIEEEFRQFQKDVIKDDSDERINQLNEEYIKKLELTQGNQEEIKALNEQHSLDLIEEELNKNEMLLTLATVGSEEQKQLINNISSLKVRIAQDTANKEIQEVEKVKAKEKEILEQRAKAILAYSESIGQILGNLAVGQKESAKDLMKSMVHSALNSLKALSLVWVAQAIGGSMATIQSIATAGIAGAVQAVGLTVAIEGAVVAAESGVNALIDKFAKGTNDAPGGMAFVGERGRELVTLPSGQRYLTPETATLTYLPKHSEVTPAHLVENELRETLKMENVTDKSDNKLMLELISTIKSKPTVNFSVNQNGISVISRKGNSTTNWLNSTYRGKC